MIVRESVQLVRSDATERGIGIRIDAAGDVPTVIGDRVQFNRSC